MLRLLLLPVLAFVICCAESSSFRENDARFGIHGGFIFGRGGRRHPPFHPRPHPHPRPQPGFRCQCTAAYNVVLFGRRVGAYCADWIRDGGKYCYLAGGMLAHSCPGARRSRRGRFFHTEDDSVCNACPPLCKMSCPNGFEKDAKGCQICKCKKPACPPICKMYCLHGFEKDANGCDVCKCKQGALIGRKRESDVFVNIGAEAKMWHVGRHNNIDSAETSTDKIDVDIGGGINGVTSGNGTTGTAIHLSVPPENKKQGDETEKDKMVEADPEKENMKRDSRSDVFINIGSASKMWHVGRHENMDLEEGTKKALDKIGVDIKDRIKSIAENSGKATHVANAGHPPMPPKAPVLSKVPKE